MDRLNARQVLAADKHGLARDYERWPARCEEALREPLPLAVGAAEGLAILGMGGSGIVGDIVRDWLHDSSAVPVVVVKEPSLPKFVKRGYLAIAVSYSGETEETVLAAREASDRGCAVVGVGTGGSLEKLCLARGHPFIKVARALAPRAALPQLLFPVVRLVSAAGIADGARELEEATSAIRGLSKTLSADKPAQTNPAKSLALRLSGKIPLVYASRLTRSAGTRFKDSLNENAKTRAIVEVLPELCHNEVVAWDAPADVPLCVVFLRFGGEPRYIEERFSALASIIRRAGYEPVELRAGAKSFLAQVLSLIYLLDYASIYLAALRGVDPLPTRPIDELKRTLYGKAKL